MKLGVVKALFIGVVKESFQKKFKWMQSQRFESHQTIHFYWNPITEIWIMHLILNSFNWKQFYVWCVCPAKFYLHIFTSFVVLHSFCRLFGSISTKDYKVASLRASLLLNLFEHSFICSLAREHQRTYTYLHTYI